MSSVYRDAVLATTGLVSYWRLGESSGTTALDETVNGRNGTNNGATVGAVSLLASDTDNTAYSFDGVNDIAETASNTAFSFPNTSPFSIECWYRTPTIPGAEDDVIAGTSAANVYGKNGKFGFDRYQSNVFNTVVGTTVIATNTTYHVVGAYDGTTMRLYVNGILDGSIAASLSITDSPRQFNIGGYVEGTFRSFFAPGVIDEIAAYNVALSAETIADHYAKGTALVPSQFARPTADVSAGAWTNQAGGTSLFAAIGETVASDTDYIQSANATPTADVSEVALGSLRDPVSSTGHIVRYRYGKDIYGGDVVNLTVSLRQGTGTQIAAWTHTNVVLGPTTVAQTLTAAQADAITDYSALRLRFSVIKV